MQKKVRSAGPHCEVNAYPNKKWGHLAESANAKGNNGYFESRLTATIEGLVVILDLHQYEACVWGPMKWLILVPFTIMEKIRLQSHLMGKKVLF